MPAYVIGEIHVRDADLWKGYVSHVGPTIASRGGEIQFRAS